MKIADTNGRIGAVTEIRSNGVFARPEDAPYTVKDAGPVHGEYITATWWQRQPDGSLRGLWYDAPAGEFVTAQEVPQ